LGYTDINQFRSDSNSNYNALQLSASKRKGDITATLSYTYAKALGQTSGINDNPEPECAFTCQLQSGQTVSWRQFYYGPLGFDRRNTLVGTYTYRLPFFRQQKGILAEALGGWEIGGIGRAQSGGPLTVTGAQIIGATASGNTQQFTRRAYLGAGAPCAAGKVCYFDTTAYIVPSATAGAGNAPAGNIIGPGYADWDMSLRKRFKLPGEGMSLAIQADAFNVLNHANLQNPSTTVGTQGFGVITGANPPRQLQFGGRFTF
jgi:hypothetical protein